MQPLYFLPGLSAATLAPGGKLTRSVLEARGLATIFADVVGPHHDCVLASWDTRGPGNKSGVCLAYNTPTGEPPRQHTFQPTQEWTEISDELWIGIDPNDPPQPADMARRKQFNGYWVELSDRRWLIPTVRRPDDSSELPTDLYVDPKTGRLCEPIKAAYRRQWEDTAEVLKWFTTEGGFDPPHFDKLRCLELAVQALSINYRFGMAEQSVLKIVDNTNYLTLHAMAIDLPTAWDAQKKTGQSTLESIDQPPTSPSSSDGPPDA